MAELEATTVRKGNKKVSVTLSGWVVKFGTWWDDGHENNFYVGDKDTTCRATSPFPAARRSLPAGPAVTRSTVETAGNERFGAARSTRTQFNDNDLACSATSTRCSPICGSRATSGAP